jgi:putative DNA primase/helicase
MEYFTDKNLDQLNTEIKKPYYQKNYGKPVAGYSYNNGKGIWCCVTRFEKDGKKSVIPFQVIEGEVKTGKPKLDKYPLYNQDKLNPDLPVLIVEGEKCGNIEVEGWNVVSWIGGSNAVNKADWSVLQGYDIVIWRDNDDAGVDVENYLMEVFEEAKYIDVSILEEKQDIADVKNPLSFINNYINSRKTALEDIEDAWDESQKIDEPFDFLGFYEGGHYFLLKNNNIIETIPRTGMSKTRLFHIAPLSWWQIAFPQRNGVNWDSAIDYIIQESLLKGFFNPDMIRGVGIWKEKDRVIINDGKQTQDSSGRITIGSGEYKYIKSNKKIDNFFSIASSDEDGKELLKLFLSQGFENKFEAYALLGWSLIAPFSGCLNWRPHVWLTAASGSGKSWVLENLVYPLIGRYLRKGSGQDTPASIYREVKTDPLPIINDEMEYSKQKESKLLQIIDFAKNSSNDTSGGFARSNAGGGVEKFHIRSCFLFSSITTLLEEGSTKNRFVVCRLKSDYTEKITKSRQLVPIILKSANFRARMMKEINNVITNIDYLIPIITKIVGSQRRADVISPLLAAVFAVLQGGLIKDYKGIEETFFDLLQFQTQDKETINDEDILLETLFDKVILTNDKITYSIGGLIHLESGYADYEKNKSGELENNGITFTEIDNVIYLCIAKRQSQISEILNNTMYKKNYASVLERSRFCEQDMIGKRIRFSGVQKYAVFLRWQQIKNEMFYDENKTFDIL